MLNEVNIKKETIVFGNDSVVISKYVSGLVGGRTLDTAGFADPVIKAGHVIIKTAGGNYAPMPVADGVYGALPEGASYAGILYRSIPTKEPVASIMIDGIVNPETVPFKIDGIKEAFTAACPHIIFLADEEA